MTIDHPILGSLTRERDRWSARPDGAAFPVVLEGATDGPDAAVIAAAAEAVRDLDALEQRGREYARVVMPAESPRLSLTGLEVLRPHPAWIKQSVAPHNPHVAKMLDAGAPAVSLEFSITGDRNVLDIVCLDGEPIGWEYH